MYTAVEEMSFAEEKLERFSHALEIFLNILDGDDRVAYKGAFEKKDKVERRPVWCPWVENLICV